MLYEVITVHRASTVGEMGLNPGNKGTRHIGHNFDDLFGRATVLGQVLFEGFQGLFAFPGNSEDHRFIGPVQVNKDGDIPMARITSYNVCYTKLLRDETKSRKGHRYVTVFIDLDQTDKPVVFAVAGKGKQTLPSKSTCPRIV